MAQRNISLDQVMEATAEAVDSGLLQHDEGSIIGPGGIIETPNQRLNVRTVLPIVTPNDLAQVPIETVPPPVDPAAEAPRRRTLRPSRHPSSGWATSPTSSRTTSPCSATARSTTASG